jgi:predicted DNA-binding transcriptional regulator
MKGLTSIERIILECLGKRSLNYREVQDQTGLKENVCFNVLQSLIIRGLLRTDGIHYSVASSLPPSMMEEINSIEAKYAETLEMIEAVLEQKEERTFRFQKIALDEKDEKIFLALLSNLETFLIDADKKAKNTIPFKERKVIFWGMGEVKSLLDQLTFRN